MKELEANMRGIKMDGLTWGASKLVPVGYGISKLQVNLVVEDEKVSIDDLQGQIEGDEDHVQSTDVVSLALRVLANKSLIMTFCSGCDAKALDTCTTRFRLDSIPNFLRNISVDCSALHAPCRD